MRKFEKGYSLIELILGLVIISFVVLSSIGIYSASTGNIEEATIGLVSKLKNTQEFAKQRDASKILDVPHIELSKKEMQYIVELNDINYLYKKTPYLNNLLNNIEVTNNFENNILYFSTQGYPVDENGKLLEDVKIYVSKKVLGMETMTYTIKIDCTGNIKIVKSKDTSPKQTCSLANKEETLEKIIICANGEELYNGKCVKACNYDQKRENGICKDICPKGQVYKADGTCSSICNPTFILNTDTNTCECAFGYETFNGVCVEKCKDNESRNSIGACTCNEGYGRKDNICVKLTESEKYGCTDKDVENPPLLRTTIHADDNFHAYLSKYPANTGIEWDYDQDWNHGMYSSMKAIQLEEDVNNYYLQIKAWNDDGDSIIENASIQIEAATNKPYYVFDNGKNYISTATGPQYFMISRNGFGETIPFNQVARGHGAIWTNDNAYGTVYVTLRLHHIQKGDKCSY